MKEGEKREEKKGGVNKDASPGLEPMQDLLYSRSKI